MYNTTLETVFILSVVEMLLGPVMTQMSFLQGLAA